jgi:hypothetical protein
MRIPRVAARCGLAVRFSAGFASTKSAGRTNPPRPARSLPAAA